MKQKIEQFTAYFDTQIANCAEQEKRLLADGRKDEATFAKIRANIYGIFCSILGVAVNHCGENAEALRAFFLQRVEHIPASWRTSYETAKQHNDVVKMQIETTKLAVVQEITTTFTEILGDNT